MSDNIQLIDLELLHFDPRNPRLGPELAAANEQAVLAHMLESERILELVQSIGQQDYFAGEPLLVTKRDSENGYWVLEGNRRLTALKILAGKLPIPSKLISLKEAVDAAIFKPLEVPCVEFEDRKEITRYLGFRHITGQKKWESLEKARYLKLLREYNYEHLDRAEQYQAMALDIGSRADYVARQLTGLAIYEKAEEMRYFGNANLRREHIQFSLLTTALSYSSISEYIGLASAQDEQCEGLKLEALKDIYSWVFAQDQQGDTILKESRNLKKLSRIVASLDAVAVLRDSKDLELAYLLTEGPEDSILLLLQAAQKQLQGAHGQIVRYRGQIKAIFDAAQEVFDWAKSVRNEAQNKLDD